LWLSSSLFALLFVLFFPDAFFTTHNHNHSIDDAAGGRYEFCNKMYEAVTFIIIIIIVKVLGLNSETASIISKYYNSTSSLPKRRHVKGF